MNKPHEAALFGLIGNTPLIEVTRLDTGPAACSSSWNRKTPAARSRTASACPSSKRPSATGA